MFGTKLLAIVGSWLIMANAVFADDAIPLLTSVGQPFKHPYCPAIDDPLHPVQFGYPTDCTMYYSCQSGYAYAMSCPLNLHWSSLTYRCDYPDVAKCIIGPNPSNPTATATPPNTGSEQTTSYQPFPGDCNRFYKCDVMNCPVNLHWNNQRQKCDWPQMAQCENPQTSLPPLPPAPASPTTPYPMAPTASTPPTTSVATIPPPFVPSAPTNGLDELCRLSAETYLKYPGDCHKFIQCNGNAIVQECPAQLQWNSKLKACDRYCV